MIGKFIDTSTRKKIFLTLSQAIRLASEKKRVLTALRREAFTEFISLKNRK